MGFEHWRTSIFERRFDCEPQRTILRPRRVWGVFNVAVVAYRARSIDDERIGRNGRPQKISNRVASIFVDGEIVSHRLPMPFDVVEGFVAIRVDHDELHLRGEFVVQCVDSSVEGICNGAADRQEHHDSDLSLESFESDRLTVRIFYGESGYWCLRSRGAGRDADDRKS